MKGEQVMGTPTIETHTDVMAKGGRLRIALPKGRLFESTVELFTKAGITIEVKGREYKPRSSESGIELFIIKPRNIPKMVEQGLIHAGIVGNDLVEDEGAKVDTVLDLGLMPVHIVVAGKKGMDENGFARTEKLRVATEYAGIASEYFSKRGITFEILKTYGSTECFVPDFADVIVDHAQTGSSLRENDLRVLDVVMSSSTKIIAHKNLDTPHAKILQNIVASIDAASKSIDRSYHGFLSAQDLRENKFVETATGTQQQHTTTEGT